MSVKSFLGIGLVTVSPFGEPAIIHMQPIFDSNSVFATYDPTRLEFLDLVDKQCQKNGANLIRGGEFIRIKDSLRPEISVCKWQIINLTREVVASERCRREIQFGQEVGVKQRFIKIDDDKVVRDYLEDLRGPPVVIDVAHSTFRGFPKAAEHVISEFLSEMFGLS